MASERRDEILYGTVHLGDVLDLSAALVAIGLLALVYGDRSGAARVLLALGFAVFVPGRAIVTNWSRMAQWSEAAMAIVFSVAVTASLATATLWTRAWHPAVLLSAEAWLSVAGLGFGIARRHVPALGAPAAARSTPRSQDE